MRLPFRDDPISLLATGLLTMIVLVGLIGPLLPLGDPNAIGVGPALAPPGSKWLLGTDDLARSQLPRVLQGIRATLLLSSASVLVTTIAATALGLLVGYLKGAIDEIVVRLADILFSFPAILMAILLSAIIGPGLRAAALAIVIITLPLMLRVVRSATIVVAEREFVTACQVAGGSLGRVLFVQLLPNIAGPVLVQATYALSVAMLVESSLSFLGLGVQPPAASLGSLLHGGILYLPIAPWLVFAPGAILAFAILSVNLIGDGLRDAVDPRTPRLLQ